MSKSTPLNELSDGHRNSEDIVQDVLNDLDDDMMDEPDYDEIDQQHQNRYQKYQHDPSQVTHYQHENQGQIQGTPQPRPPQMVEGFEGMSMGQIVWEELKSPLLFILLFVVLNLKMVDQMLLKYIPESGMTATYSILRRALLGAILFYLVRTFLLPIF